MFLSFRWVSQCCHSWNSTALYRRNWASSRRYRFACTVDDRLFFFQQGRQRRRWQMRGAYGVWNSRCERHTLMEWWNMRIAWKRNSIRESLEINYTSNDSDWITTKIFSTLNRNRAIRDSSIGPRTNCFAWKCNCRSECWRNSSAVDWSFSYFHEHRKTGWRKMRKSEGKFWIIHLHHDASQYTYHSYTSHADVIIALMQKSTGMTFECFQLRTSVECKTKKKTCINCNSKQSAKFSLTYHHKYNELDPSRCQRWSPQAHLDFQHIPDGLDSSKSRWVVGKCRCMYKIIEFNVFDWREKMSRYSHSPRTPKCTMSDEFLRKMFGEGVGVGKAFSRCLKNAANKFRFRLVIDDTSTNFWDGNELMIVDSMIVNSFCDFLVLVPIAVDEERRNVKERFECFDLIGEFDDFFRS